MLAKTKQNKTVFGVIPDQSHQLSKIKSLSLHLSVAFHCYSEIASSVTRWASISLLPLNLFPRKSQDLQTLWLSKEILTQYTSHLHMTTVMILRNNIGVLICVMQVCAHMEICVYSCYFPAADVQTCKSPSLLV